jgi:hypothetical protein
MLHRFVRVTALIATAITVMSLIACGDDMDTSEVVKTSETQESAPVNAVSVDGSIVPIESFNSKPTVLWFWAPN